ncbi:hypothetical protein C8A03DRAFT_17878 [Achaetomium macrosporum]|uniref:Hydrophobin 3 n=1 Tax=Achaetomium macrosporum TaxID=79813 RepID=A0AAN7C5L5_9PEZI|nr:hypothetical protein C8A03DRAFT_17878 [Achaetomium macrosporum]
MQFTSIFSILAVAMTAAALPSAGVAPRTGDVGSCNSQTSNVCCDGVLGCVVTVLGKNCEGSSYCCETTAAQGSLVDVDALKCVKVL